MKRLVLVEDTYGAIFHRTLINKLIELCEGRKLETESLCGNTRTRKPRIRRLPAKKCNPAMANHARAIVAGSPWRILVVIDSEGKPDAPDYFVRRRFRRDELDDIRVVTVEPMHEAWLCIGLGGDRRICRRDPIQAVQRLLNSYYEKRMLAKLAPRIHVEILIGERDFDEYLDCLKWLTSP